MSTRSEAIGQRIKEARKAKKYSQTQLAVMLNKTLRSVQKYESGEIEPSIALLNDIAKALEVSPATLIGYQTQEIRLDSLSDVFFVLSELNKKAGLRFEVDVRKPPADSSWACSLRFDGMNRNAPNNEDICLFLERFADERAAVESYMADQGHFNHWLETELAYYANVVLEDKPVEELTTEERIQRRNELGRQIQQNGGQPKAD